MLLSFIIATYKNNHSLLKAVITLLEICDAKKIAYEIIVVDNYDTDEYIKVVADLQRNEIVLLKNTVKGAHFSRLKGLNHSSGKLVIVVDDDNYLTETYIDFIIAQDNGNDEIFMGCATKEFHPVDWDIINLACTSYACGSLEGYPFKAGVPVYWGAGMVLSRSLAVKIFENPLIVEGRVDKKDYIMSGEDHEISMRAYLLNARSVYFSEIGLYHDIDLKRLNNVYYKRLMTGLSYASWLLRPYYALVAKRFFSSKPYLWLLYNLCCANAYFMMHPLKKDSSLILKDAFSFRRKLKQYRILLNYK